MAFSVRQFPVWAILLTLPAAPAGADTIAIPVDPLSGFSVPFGAREVSRYQQVFDASLFGFVFEIDQISFSNTVNNGSGDRNLDPAVYDIRLATTSRPVGGLDATNFDSNVGSSSALVFSGSLGCFSLPGSGCEDGEGTVPPGPGSLLTFSLATSFLYDPREGNLLLDVRKTGGVLIGDDGVFLDVAMLGSLTGAVSDLGGNPTFHRGLAAQLSGEFGEAVTVPPDPAPVPEPASLLLLGSGLAVAAWRKRRRG